MKKFITVLAIAAATFSASAQFFSGPAVQSALVISTAFYVPGETTTNIPSALAPIVKPGASGIGFYVLAGGTNATTTTNATFLFTPVAGSSARLVDNQAPYGVYAAQSVAGYDTFTNLVATTVNLANVPGLKLTSIQNTNTLGIWITNVTAYAR